MRTIIIRTYAFTASFLLFSSLALYILSGALNHSYTSSVSSSTNLGTITRIESEEITYGPFKQCVKYYKGETNDITSGVMSNVVNQDYCSLIDLNCNIVDSSGNQRDAFCPDSMFCNNDSKNTIQNCNIFNAYRALLILGGAAALLAWLLMMLSMCTLGRCSSGLAMTLALLSGFAGLISMAVFVNLAENIGLFAVKSRSDYAVGFWLQVGAWPLAVIGSFIFIPKVRIISAISI